MEVLVEKGEFSIKSFSVKELRALRDEIEDKVFGNYTSFDTSGLNPNPEKQVELSNKKSNLYTLNLGLFHKERFIGWSNGTQSADNRFYMKNSGVLPEFQKQGLYSLLLDTVLSETKKEGFLEVYSNHNTENNPILIAKMKKGFFISGFEILPKYGLTVQLTYSHSREIKEMFQYRVGKPMSAGIKDRFKG